MRFYLILAITSLYLTGCATASRGTHEVVEINSEPSGAKAISNIPNRTKTDNINGFYGCEPTPCSINFSRRAEPVISIEKAGYENIKFKVISSVATSSSSVPKGSIVAGTPEGSYVVAGSPDFIKSIPIGGASIIGGLMTFGGGTVIDVATGAGLSLSPNPVTAFLAPTEEKALNINQLDKTQDTP